MVIIDTLSIDMLGLPTMTTNALKYCADVETVGELRQMTSKELGAVPGIGRKGVRAIAEALRGFPPP